MMTEFNSFREHLSGLPGGDGSFLVNRFSAQRKNTGDSTSVMNRNDEPDQSSMCGADSLFAIENIIPPTQVKSIVRLPTALGKQRPLLAAHPPLTGLRGKLSGEFGE